VNPHFQALEFDIILEQLKAQALSEQARQELDALVPCKNENVCRMRMAQTTAARAILDTCGTPPLVSMNGLEDLLTLAEAGAMLVPDQLTETARFAAACRRLSSYLSRGESCGPEVAAYGLSLEPLTDLQQEIEACCGEDRVYDEASPALRNIRRKAEHTEAQIKEKLGHILQSRKQYLADSYISIRSGHYVLPVQRRFQNQFGGSVIDTSGKGGTVFMEPTAIKELQAEREALSFKEDGEVRRILYTLTAHVSEQAPVIRRNMEAMAALDVLFAKAKYSAQLGAGPVEISGARSICLLSARHPLLPAERCVPLDFVLEGGTSGVIITGPNTGGKTVALKTVGLLSLMAQCGLHIPCAPGSCIAMQDGYWCDIGDSQNISQNLSTFSGHITNVIHILENASRDSLVLLDELGSGTDPAEGMGIAIAVLEELRLRGCTFLVTTHYPQVKTYAEQTEGIQSARMAFDKESLCPLYRLEMGKSGESCALYIAGRLGMPQQLLERARHEVYGTPGYTAPERPAIRAPKSALVRTPPERQGIDPAKKFTMGDSVEVQPRKEIGVVYRPADEKGYVIVQIKGIKWKIRHDRLRLKESAAELYPPDYDFSVVFDTVANRKARHILNKRYDANATIIYESEDYEEYK
jgi:DNA mismatch repair protein MutS2